MKYGYPHAAGLALSVLLLAGVVTQGAIASASAQEETSPVTMKARYRGTVLMLTVHNEGSTDISGFEIYMTENAIKRARAPSGWVSDMDETSAYFSTDGRPIAEDKQATFRIILAEKKAPSALEWAALDDAGNELTFGSWSGMPARKPSSVPSDVSRNSELSLFTASEDYGPRDRVKLYGRGVPNAEVIVSVFGGHGHAVAKAVAKPEGDGSYKVEVELEPAIEGTYKAEASQLGKSAYVSFMVMGAMTDDQTSHMNHLQVSVENKEYLRGENVVIYGRGIHEAGLLITVFNSEGDLVFKEEPQIGTDGAFKTSFMLGQDAVMGEYKIVAKMFAGEHRIATDTGFRVVQERTVRPVVSMMEIAVFTDAEQYKPGSEVMITIKTTTPGKLTVGIINPNDDIPLKQDVETNREGIASVGFHIEADAPAGEWKVLVIQGPSNARTAFLVVS